MPVIPGSGLDFAELVGRRSADPLPPWAAQGCSVRVVRIEPGPRIPHRHPRSIEVAYVAEGSGVAWEGDGSSEVSTGDLLVVPVGVPHATVATDASGLLLVCFFPTGDFASNLEELPGPLRDAGPSSS